MTEIRCSATDARARIARSETIDPKKLSSPERAALSRSILDLYRDVFDGNIDLGLIESSVVETTSDESRILLHTGEDGRALGYGALHFFQRNLRGRSAMVVRGQAAMRRSVRGQKVNVLWAPRTFMEQRLRRPMTPFFGLVSLMHPASYLQIHRYLPGAWPRREAPMPPEILQFMVELADEFRLRSVDPQRPLVREIGFRTRDTEAERTYWKQCEKPAARFFLELNPSYHAGHGLLTLVPFTPAVLSGLGARLLRDRAVSGGERVLDGMERWPVVSPIVRARSIRKHLAAAPLFSRLDAEDLDTLVKGATKRALPGGSYVFRQGDEGDAVYVVSRGIVAVLSEQHSSSDGERVVEQLGPGSIFGEAALLSGGGQSASIRTLTRSTLIRISADAIRAVMDRNESIRTAFVNRARCN
jgi:hypothetical protein